QCKRHPRALHSSPTRRSSDLGPLIIGGKSMGGRVASMVADELLAEGRIAGLLCLGYPFHPPGKLQQLRTRHLENLRTPTLICQGDRKSTRLNSSHVKISYAVF